MLDKATIEKVIQEAFHTWDYPSIPNPIYSEIYQKDINLGILESNFAFMEYPSYQVYLNLERIISTFEDSESALKAITKHEFGHRYVPYDTATSIILKHFVIKSVKEIIPNSYLIPYEIIINLFTDLCINTSLVNKGDRDIIYLYQQLTKTSNSDTWNVYIRSMEKAWGVNILPKKIFLKSNLESAAQSISNLFREEILNKEKWIQKISEFTKYIYKFLDHEVIYLIPSVDSISYNIPQEIDDELMKELVKNFKRDIDSLNVNNMKDLLDIMSESDEDIKSAIKFYDLASQYYTVRFAKKSFGGTKKGRFQPIKWHPSMGCDKLDLEYSVTSGGRIIPSITTYAWKTRERKRSKIKENILDLDLYIDSSGSMPNPISNVSLPVLAGFVVSKIAHKKGAKISVTNFSEDFVTQEPTTNLNDIFEKLVLYYGEWTEFPVSELRNPEKKDPRLVLIITDTFLGNYEDTAEAIKELTRKGNLVCIYGISDIIYKSEFEKSGAQVIQGVTTDIFRDMIGKTYEVYDL